METVMKCRVYITRIVIENSCVLAGFLGVVLGSLIKVYVEQSEWKHYHLDLPGEMLLRMLELITIPHIISSVITGFSPLRGDITETFALRATAYLTVTTVLSMSLGLCLVICIQPGAKNSAGIQALPFASALKDTLWNLAPENLIVACYQQHKTELAEFEIVLDQQLLTLEMNSTIAQLAVHDVEGANILALIFWSFIFGQVINRITQFTHISLEAINSLNVVTKHAVNLILCYEPFALVFMVTTVILEAKDWGILFKLGKFVGVVVLGLVILAIAVLPLIYVLCTRRNPYAVIKGVFPALKTAFISSSSSATLPHTYQCCEETLQINKKISRFMLPIETNINMNGSVLYEVVAAVFIAQLNNMSMGLNHWVSIALTSAVLCTGPAGIPARGAVTTFFILRAVFLPTKEACILVFVEFFLDRCSTFINVLGDCIGVALLHEVSKRGPGDMEEQREETKSSLEA